MPPEDLGSFGHRAGQTDSTNPLGLALPAVALATLGTSYVMVGIDQIGLELEQPFQLLPMNSLAAALTRDVCDELCVH